jgi:uncharacterized membrane protein YagU involved in acid resistance
MSAVMAAGRSAGLLWNPPPRTITYRLERAIGLRHQLDREAFTVTWVIAHLAYGAGFGAIFRLLTRLVGRPSPLAGAMYGAGLWAISYLGWLPALGLFPKPADSPGPRRATMIAAHLVYGLALAIAQRGLTDQTQDCCAVRDYTAAA